MSEFRKIEPIFDQDKLQKKLHNPLWRDLAPNYPHPRNLLPQTLTARDINEIVEGLAALSPLPCSETCKPQVDFTRERSLSYHNHGESNWCYVLNFEGQKMAVIVSGYEAQFGIPQDPKLCLTLTGVGKNSVAYSDLRRYLFLPIHVTDNSVDMNLSVVFQEWGGEKKLTDYKDPRISLVAPGVRHYIKKHGCIVTSITNGELDHPRHYLLNQGVGHLPAVIDIPCEQITRSNQY